MAPQASRRFHEAGVGSRTGLRLSAVARDQDGFEDLEAFYKASQAALDHRQEGDADSDEAGDDDYDSFDETHFSRRSSKGAGKDARKNAPSSSSAMDLQTSSAPSPRSVLRTSRPASSYAGSPSRRSHAQAPNMTLADDDDDDFDLPNLSTGSRSFDLGALAGDDDVDDRDAPSAPARGLSARQAQPIPASAKGKKAAAPRRVDLLDSDSDDQGPPADAHRRFQKADDDAEMSSDYDIVPISSSPARKKKTAASKPRSPAAKTASKAASTSASGSRTGVAQRDTTPPTARPGAAHSPQQKPARSPKKVSRPPPPPEISYEDSRPNFMHDESPQPDPQPSPPTSPPAKRKRGRPPKNQAAQSNILDDLQPEEQLPPAKKKSAGRTAGSGVKSKKVGAEKANAKQRTGEVVEKVRAQPREATVIDENGVRRSTRQRFAPLEYWRGERVRYGRPSLPNEELRASQRPGEDDFEDSLGAMPMRKRVPVLDVKEVIRVPRAPGEGTFAGTTRARATRRRAAPSTAPRKAEEKLPKRGSAPPDGDEDEWLLLDPTADTVHVEDGWDRETLETGLVIDEDGEEVEMSVVRTKDSLHPIMAAGQQFGFEKIFNCGGLMATGVLHLPPGTRKPTKPSKDNSFVFCVLQGALRATVHRKSFIVGPHGIFQVPAGNTYALENICQRDVHLFFAQCRKTRKANAGDLTTFTQASDTSYSVPGWTDSQRVLQSPQQSQQSRQSQHQPPPLSDDEDDFETSRQLKSKKRVFRKV